MKKMISRSALFWKLDNRVTVISAPSGFGKTTFVREWCDKQEGLSAWLRIQEDCDPERFLTKAKKMISSLFQQSHHGEIPSALVIDHCERVESEVLESLVRDSAVSVKLILISRRRLSIDATEVTTEDLRFTTEQSYRFFEDRIGQPLSDREFAELHEWGNGWPGGMQLLSLTVADYGGIPEWVAYFDGHHYFFTEYFSKEWRNTDPGVRDFLLQSSVPDGFDDSFCQTLSDKNCLHNVIEHCFYLQTEEGAYQYEPLFRGFLQMKLRSLSRSEQQKAFSKAALWYERKGKKIESVDLALRSGDIEKAASLILQFAPDILKEGRWKAVDQWAGLPEKLSGEQKARVLLFYCWVYFLRGAYAGLGEYMEQTEKAIAEGGLPDGYRGELMLLRSFISIVTKDGEQAIEKCDRAISLLADGGVFWDAELDLNPREAQVTRGKIGFDGRPRLAIRFFRHFIQYRRLLPKTMEGFGYVALAEAAYETNCMGEALKAAEKALVIARETDNISMRVPAVLIYTQIMRKKGAFDKGLSEVREAKQAAKGRKRIWRFLLAAQEIRLRLGQRNIQEAKSLVYEYILHEKYGTTRFHEFEGLSYVRVLIEEGDYERAELFLKQLLLEVESRDRYGTRMEIMVLQAVIFQKRNQIHKGLQKMASVIEFAEKEGFMRTLLDEGRPVYDLLRRMHSSSPYVKRLLACFQKELDASAGGPALTGREQDVLHLIKKGWTNKEIAVSLHVTVGTVKGYTSVLYKKLKVRNRTQAVARARELNL